MAIFSESLWHGKPLLNGLYLIVLSITCWYIFELTRDYLFKIRAIKEKNFLSTPEGFKSSFGRTNFLNLEFVVSEETFEVLEKRGPILVFEKRKGLLKKINNGVAKSLNLNNISHILMEYDSFYFFTLKPYDANWLVWESIFYLVKKDGKRIRLFKVKSFRDIAREILDDEKFDTDENYRNIAMRALNIMAYELNLSYLIIDYKRRS